MSLVHQGHQALFGGAASSRVSGEKEEGSVLNTLLHLSILASVGVSAYHGYKRNHGSIGWGIGWGILGGIGFPFTPGIAAAQGLGKPLPRGK